MKFDNDDIDLRPDMPALRRARDKFADLLGNKTKEAEWQQLFCECPFILSEALPLRLEPRDIVPLGRPGRSEADFIFYPRQRPFLDAYGVIELKRSDTSMLRLPRKNVLALASDAQIAVAQGKIYAQQLHGELITRIDQVVIVGNRRHIFIILGMSSEVAQKVKTDMLRKQFERLLPMGINLIPYDTLLRLFEARVLPAMHFVVPIMSSDFATRGCMRVKIAPIIGPVKNHTWESEAVFNPGVVRLKDKTYLLYTAMGDDGVARIGLAVSEDGIGIIERLAKPIFEPFMTSEEKGCKDPRLTLLGDRIYMVYVASDGLVDQIALASIGVKEFLMQKWSAWRRHGLAFPGFTEQGGTLFPEKFADKFALLHCVDPHLWLSFSSHVRCPWTRKEHKIVMGAGIGMQYDARRMVWGNPPLKTKRGWFTLYNGQDYHGTWRLGAALIPLQDIERYSYRSEGPILEPCEAFEVGDQFTHDFDRGVYCCGAVSMVKKELIEDNDDIFVYYGGAHNQIGLGITSLSSLVQRKVFIP